MTDGRSRSSGGDFRPMLSCISKLASRTYYMHIVDVIFAGGDVVEVNSKGMVGE